VNEKGEGIDRCSRINEWRSKSRTALYSKNYSNLGTMNSVRGGEAGKN